MLYNLEVKSKYFETAGKITIAAAVSGLLIFAFVFLFNAGKTELMRVEAQTATTTLTVLNTPPQWVTLAYEENESSTSTPTNSGSQISWVATASNNGGAPYYLIVCSTNATPTIPAVGSPSCNGGVQWGVSTTTVESTQARVATTTTEVGAFAGEVLPWFAWVCDNDPVNPRCNNTYSQGLNATNSSPFHVNFRPTFTAVDSDSPANPGESLTFISTSTDGNVVRGPDNIFMYVCNGNDFVPATRSCVSGVLASTTVGVASNPTATFTLPPVIQDSAYDAYVYIIDQYNHPASGGVHASNEGFTVSNVAPTVTAGTVSINGGSNMVISVEAGQTTNFTLDFITSDANSCLTTASTSEMTSYTASLFRSGIGTTTCTGLPGSYNPNNCYPSSVAPLSWNLNCTASTTTCTNNTDPTISWSCTFPLWYITDPTDALTPYEAQNWLAAIAGVDNNNATGTATVGTTGVEVNSYRAIDILDAAIAYSQLEPGQNMSLLSASSTVFAVGNTGINTDVTGESMCPTFSVGNDCVNSSSSTIPEFKQEFATSSVAYNSGTQLSSTTPGLIDLRVLKSTSTTTPSSGVTYWGIGVPGTITTAGAYTGLNTFTGVSSPIGNWY